MQFGKDFFKVLNLVIKIMRLFAEVFGSDEDQAAIADSRARTANDNPDDVC